MRVEAFECEVKFDRGIYVIRAKSRWWRFFGAVLVATYPGRKHIQQQHYTKKEAMIELKRINKSKWFEINL